MSKKHELSYTFRYFFIFILMLQYKWVILMKKHEFKRILLAFDEIERNELNFNNLACEIKDELKKQNFFIDDDIIVESIKYLRDLQMIKINPDFLDLNPPISIYAKASHNSLLELLSLCESMISDDAFIAWVEHDLDLDYFHKLPNLSKSLLKQTQFFDEAYSHTKFLSIIQLIIQMHQKSNCLLSPLTYALYTAKIVNLNNHNLEFRNENNQIHQYDDLDLILKLLPKKGIPSSRDETKSLQSFYKDVLFNEFNHRCPICGNKISFMLIASHIKPFRDCAHIYEAIDHNNGLLLCKNHDYLFDQGYFSFDDHGKMLISSLIEEKDYPIYQLDNQYHLPNSLQTKDRIGFIQYHRKYIYKK